MICVTIDGVVQEAQAGERLIDVVNRTASKVPQVCYHPQVTALLETKLFWSAVTCHRFGPWRPAAMLPRRSICLLESFYSPALRLVAADQSADRSDPLQRGSRSSL